MRVVQLSTHSADSLRQQGQTALLWHVASSEIAAEGLQLSFCQMPTPAPGLCGQDTWCRVQWRYRGGCWCSEHSENNSFPTDKITATLLIGNKQMWPTLATPTQDSRSSAGHLSGEKGELCYLKIDLPLILVLLLPAFIVFHSRKSASFPKLPATYIQILVLPDTPGHLFIPHVSAWIPHSWKSPSRGSWSFLSTFSTYVSLVMLTTWSWN